MNERQERYTDGEREKGKSCPDRNGERKRAVEEKDEVCSPLRVIKVVNEARGLMGWRNVVIGSLL